MRSRVAVTVKAPRHTQWLHLLNLFHFGNIAMATYATNTCINMERVIEICVLRQQVHVDPFDRFACRPALANCKQFLTLWQDKRVAVHTCLSGRYICNRRPFNIAVTITAVHTQITGMQLMAKRHRLCRTVSDIGVLWRPIIPEKSHSSNSQNGYSRQKHCRKFVSPLWKYLRQKESSISYFFHKALCTLSHAEHRYCYVTISTFHGVLAGMIKNSPEGVKKFSA